MGVRVPQRSGMRTVLGLALRSLRTGLGVRGMPEGVDRRLACWAAGRLAPRPGDQAVVEVTGRRVIAVDCMQHFTIYVDALADIDVAEVSAWVEDGDYVDDAPCDDVSYSGHVLDVGHVRNVLSRGYGVVVMDNDRCHVGNVSTWDDLVAMRQQIEPDPKAPMTGQLDIFGGEVGA